MRRILHKLVRVPEAPVAHIQPLGFAPSDQVLGVERWIFGRDTQVSQHDVADVLRAMHGLSDWRTVLRRGDGGWEGERHFLLLLLLLLLSVFNFSSWHVRDRDYIASFLGGWTLIGSA